MHTRPTAVGRLGKLGHFMLCSLLAGWAGVPALAESVTAPGGRGGTASARVEFRVHVPKFLLLQVGSVGATVNRIDLAPAPQQLAQTPSAEVGGTGGQGGGSVAITVQGTPGTDNVNLTFRTTDSSGAARAALSDGIGSVPWSTVKVTTSGADAALLAHPSRLADGSVTDVNVAAPLSKVAGVIDLKATWTYGWVDGSTIYPASASGGYTGRVAYKLSTP